MGPMPDMSGLVYFALFGMTCTAIIVSVATWFVIYHIVMALIGYIGA